MASIQILGLQLVHKVTVWLLHMLVLQMAHTVLVFRSSFLGHCTHLPLRTMAVCASFSSASNSSGSIPQLSIVFELAWEFVLRVTVAAHMVL